MSRGGHYDKIPSSEDATGRGGFNRYGNGRDYSPMRATNPFTGQLQEVILLEPRKLEKLVAVETNFELREDLRRVFSNFNQHQRRVLFRVLVQGQSIETATRGMKRTSQWWRTWYGRAIQQLQAELADYRENGKLVVA